MNEHITLNCGGYSAKIRLSGGQIMSWITPEGKELIWQGNPDVWPQHSTILFPVCGAAKDDEVIVAGKHYPMNKHGFTKTAPFVLEKQGRDFAELVYRANENTRASYPFDFAFHVTYTLFEGGYTTEFLVENTGLEPMPFCVGGHPGYTCPLEDGAAFEDYQIVFDHPESGRHALLGTGGIIAGWEQLTGFCNETRLPLAYETFDRFDTLLFRDLQSQGVSLVHKETGKGLRMTFPKFPALALWTATGKRAPYLCIEPWIGLPASADESAILADKPYAVTVAPGESYKAWFTTTLI